MLFEYGALPVFMTWLWTKCDRVTVWQCHEAFRGGGRWWRSLVVCEMQRVYVA
jgi:hypothetical protein